VEVNVRFTYISIKGDWESSKAEAAFLNIAYHQGQEVPYNLTDSEKLEYGNKSKTHS
jgi:hypothetical protein